MKNIHVLPSPKPSSLFKVSNELKLTRKYDVYNGSAYQHIYITSDEEIKEGNWYLSTLQNTIDKCEDIISQKNVNLSSWLKKVILSTDQDLIKDGVQAIDDEFLEWFVKNPSCEEVEVIKEQHNVFVGMKVLPMIPNYKIIIPKEEPKQEIELVNGFIPTSFFEKQETLEEVAKRMYGNDEDGYYVQKRAFKIGAKWKMEKSYSEEDMIKAICMKKDGVSVDSIMKNLNQISYERNI
jgi:hypothetical protein